MNDLKVLMLNGSSNARGNTNRALTEIASQLEKEGIASEIFQLGSEPIRDCIGCRQCTDDGCIFDENGIRDFIAKARGSDGFVFGTPVYYAHPSGRILSFLDRVFHCGSSSTFAFKPAASVAIARRAGTTASLDVLNKYFGINQMPQVGSTYWNMAHGCLPGEGRLRAYSLLCNLFVV